jgi:sulfite oxidase
MPLSRRALLAAAPAVAVTASAAEFEVLAERPQQLQTPLEALDALLTPTERFFVRSHFGAPLLDRGRPLSIGGRVTRPLTLTPSDLRRWPQRTVTAVLQCAGNGRRLFTPTMPGVAWEHGAMGQAAWTGVPLSALLERAGLEAGAAHVHLFGADRPPKPQLPAFIRSLPLEKAMHPDTLVALEMNGARLPLEHGAPLRLVVPGWAGDHWLKWLTRVEVAAEEHAGFFVQKAYRIPPSPVTPGAKVPPEQMEPVTVMPVKSVITAPREGGRAKAGPLEVRGVAFSGDAAIARVEVSVDGGARWQDARLQGEKGPGRWQLFSLVVDATPGAMTAVARATDELGRVQPEAAVWNPSGYFWNACHRVAWSVS